MALEGRPRFSHVEIEPSGRTFIKVYREIVAGDKVLSSEPFRSSVEPEVTIDGQMTVVNASLENDEQGKRMSFRGVLYQPCAFVTAKKPAS